MPLLFVDSTGYEGRISDEFSIEYTGPEHVEAYVNDVVQKAPSDEHAIEELLLDMIHDLNITEVRRNGDRGPHPQEDGI